MFDENLHFKAYLSTTYLAHEQPLRADCNSPAEMLATPCCKQLFQISALDSILIYIRVHSTIRWKFCVCFKISFYWRVFYFIHVVHSLRFIYIEVVLDLKIGLIWKYLN